MSDSLDKLKVEVEKLVSDFDQLKDKMDQLEEWDSLSEVFLNFKAIGQFGMDIVVAVELAASTIEGLKSEDKLEVAAQMLDDAVELKGFSRLLEVVDKEVFKGILSTMVWVLNDKLGPDWNLDMIRDYLEKGKKYLSFSDYLKHLA